MKSESGLSLAIASQPLEAKKAHARFWQFWFHILSIDIVTSQGQEYHVGKSRILIELKVHQKKSVSSEGSWGKI